MRPPLPLIIAPTIYVQYGGQQMVGNSAAYLVGTSSRIAGTIGETLTGVYSRTGSNLVIGTNTYTAYKIYSGYQGQICNNSLWWSATCGAQSPGGAEAPAPQREPVSQVEGLKNISDIQNALNQYVGQVLTDCNGNSLIANNRYIQYDYENRPIKIVNLDGSYEAYVYDYTGQRVAKAYTPASGGATTKTVYIGTVYEENYVNNICTGTVKYVYAGSQRVAMKTHSFSGSPDSVYYFQTDHLGSTNLLTDSSGNVVRNTQYCPFGGSFMGSDTGSVDNAHKFTGQINDSGTGLYYYGARYYDPQMCTFLTPDTLVQNPYDPQLLNRYTYCRNNPVTNTDPSGNYEVPMYGGQNGTDTTATGYFNPNYLVNTVYSTCTNLDWLAGFGARSLGYSSLISYGCAGVCGIGAGIGIATCDPVLAATGVYYGISFMDAGAYTGYGSTALYLYDWQINNNEESGKEFITDIIEYPLMMGSFGLGKLIAPELETAIQPLAVPAAELGYSLWGAPYLNKTIFNGPSATQNSQSDNDNTNTINNDFDPEINYNTNPSINENPEINTGGNDGSSGNDFTGNDPDNGDPLACIKRR